MDTPQIYIVIAIAVLVVIALLVVFVSRRTEAKQLSPMAGLAFAFVLAGIIFGEDRVVGYSLLGIGVVFAVVDMINKMRHA